jgi:Cys-rich protein (TIGR01571 family)
MTTQSFQTGLLGCTSDIPSCLDGCCCPCCQVGRQCNAVDGEVNSLAILPCIGSLLFGSMPIWVICLRCKVSDKHELDEGKIMSILKGLCCPSCSLCQLHRELSLRNAWPGGLCVNQPFEMK